MPQVNGVIVLARKLAAVSVRLRVWISRLQTHEPLIEHPQFIIGQATQKIADGEAQEALLAQSPKQFALLLRPFRHDSRRRVLLGWLSGERHVEVKLPSESLTFRGKMFQRSPLEQALTAMTNCLTPLVCLEPPGLFRHFRDPFDRPGHTNIGGTPWRTVVLEAIDHAALIFVVPGTNSGILWELSVLLTQAHFLTKTFFVIPYLADEKDLKWWQSIQHAVRLKTSLNLPSSDGSTQMVQIAVSNELEVVECFRPFDDPTLEEMNRFLGHCAALCKPGRGETPVASIHVTKYGWPIWPPLNDWRDQ